MPRRWIVPRVLLVTTLLIAPAAQADWSHGPGRHWGIGWSDGYHAKNACPPRHSHNCPNCQPPSPWWATMGQPAEALPPPAAMSPAPAAGRTRVPAGHSLLRQPGEGTTVTLTDGPPGAWNSP